MAMFDYKTNSIPMDNQTVAITAADCLRCWGKVPAMSVFADVHVFGHGTTVTRVWHNSTRDGFDYGQAVVSKASKPVVVCRPEGLGEGAWSIVAKSTPRERRKYIEGISARTPSKPKEELTADDIFG